MAPNLNNIIANVSFVSSVKDSPANTIKVSAAILNVVSFSLFDRSDSDKPPRRKISHLFLVFAYEHWVTIKQKVTRMQTSLKGLSHV